MSTQPTPALPSDDREIPTEPVGRLDWNYYCRAWNSKRQKYCRNRAGARTEHTGIGRCWIHGGRNPSKTGRYRTLLAPRVAELLAEHSDTDAPLDLLPELALARAQLHEFVERTSSVANPAGLADSVKLVDRVARIVERIERIKAQNAITPSELNRLMLNMGLVVRQFVTDDETCKRIQDAWLALRV